MPHFGIDFAQHKWFIDQYMRGRLNKDNVFTFTDFVFPKLAFDITLWGRKCKDVQAKKLMKSNKINFTKKFFFDQIPLNLQFHKWAKINFWTGKKFNTAKNATSRKKIILIYLISGVFLAGLFKIFWPTVHLIRNKNLFDKIALRLFSFF